ncbi:hypothetical protein GQ53DRAFT_498393 [Thozetella sp. PMI_491]|nr:hypothetical protein GQ53DRAFT_498393 [Thozetella sp. PMI_491]
MGIRVHFNMHSKQTLVDNGDGTFSVESSTLGNDSSPFESKSDSSSEKRGTPKGRHTPKRSRSVQVTPTSGTSRAKRAKTGTTSTRRNRRNTYNNVVTPTRVSRGRVIRPRRLSFGGLIPVVDVTGVDQPSASRPTHSSRITATHQRGLTLQSSPSLDLSQNGMRATRLPMS